MANRAVSQRNELTTLAVDDWLGVVDISDTSQSANGTSKKIKASNLRLTTGTAGTVIGYDVNNAQAEFTFTGTASVDADLRTISIGGAPQPTFVTASTPTHTLLFAERIDADKGVVVQTTAATDLLVQETGEPWSWQVQRKPNTTGAVRVIGQTAAVSVNGVVGPTNPGATMATGNDATMIISCRGLVGGINYVIVEGDLSEGLKDMIEAFIVTVADKAYTLVEKALFPFRVDSVVTKSASGTTTLAVQAGAAGTTSITGVSAISVTSTQASTNATAANTLAINDKLRLLFSASSSATDVAIQVNITRL